MGSLALRPGDSLAIPRMALSVGFRSFGFPPVCDSSYRAPDSCPGGTASRWMRQPSAGRTAFSISIRHLEGADLRSRGRGSRRRCLPRGTRRTPLIDGAPVSRGWCCDHGRDADHPWPDNHIHRIGLKFSAQRLKIPCFTSREIARKGPRSGWNRVVSARPRAPMARNFPVFSLLIREFTRETGSLLTGRTAM